MKIQGVDTRATPATVIMYLRPDYIINRVDAISLGFTVYRTGEKCKNGHTGWRYTRNMVCIMCDKEKNIVKKKNIKIREKKENIRKVVLNNEVVYLLKKLPKSLPTTADEARKKGLNYYRPAKVCCPDYIFGCLNRKTQNHHPCGRVNHYTVSGFTTCYAKSNALRSYNDAKADYEPLSIAAAIKQGKDYYWKRKHDPDCGHPGKRTLDKECYFCKKGE